MRWDSGMVPHVTAGSIDDRSKSLPVPVFEGPEEKFFQDCINELHLIFT
jgi:hypothetical protein